MTFIQADSNFYADEVYDTNLGLLMIKNREIMQTSKGQKTTFRDIELKGTGIDSNHPLINLLYTQYEGSILKAYRDFNDFRDSVVSGNHVVLIPDLKGDAFFQDRWERVVRFVEKHYSTKVAITA